MRFRWMRFCWMRFGLLFPLPDDYVGERHVVGYCVPTDIPNELWCTFHEVPGPGPNAAEGASVIRMSLRLPPRLRQTVKTQFAVR